jgi:fatty acid desaturase
MGMPIKTEAADPIRLQMETTRNIDLPGILPYMYIGLGNQIEHHLFPLIPHQRMHLAVPIVKKWAAANDIRYQSIGWIDGYVDMTRYVRDAWKIEVPSGESASAEAIPALRAA